PRPPISTYFPYTTLFRSNLTDFYERKVQRFFDRNGTEKARQFGRLGSVEELKRFLEETLQEIRESDPIFPAPFEEELQARLDAADRKSTRLNSSHVSISY